MSQTDPRAVAKGIISGWYQSTEAAAGFTLGIAEHEWQRLEAIIAAVLADAERREAERCAKDVCMYCGGREKAITERRCPIAQRSVRS